MAPESSPVSVLEEVQTPIWYCQNQWRRTANGKDACEAANQQQSRGPALSAAQISPPPPPQSAETSSRVQVEGYDSILCVWNEND